ncbi:hypothetical protein ACQE98_00975 [Ornithinimicrobium sp. W1679]|jgi:hypothetical protein|uniref:hypothetical protein n=1 Tax=unclassified Ornithinimicrobium TaxID=2615080 RepID=UPI003CF3DB33
MEASPRKLLAAGGAVSLVALVVWWATTGSLLPVALGLVLVMAVAVGYVFWSSRAGSVAYGQERVEAGVRRSFPRDPTLPRM